MSTQINPMRNTTPIAAREMPAVPLAERVRSMDKTMARDDERKEPFRDEVDVTAVPRAPTVNMAAATLSFVQPNLRGHAATSGEGDGGEAQPAARTGSHAAVADGPSGTHRGAASVPGSHLPGSPVRLNDLVLPGDTFAALVGDSPDPSLLPVGPPQVAGSRSITTTVTGDDEVTLELKTPSDDSVKPPEARPQTNRRGDVVPQSSSPAKPATDVLPATTAGDTVFTEESGSLQGAENRSSSSAPAPATVPGVSTNEARPVPGPAADLPRYSAPMAQPRLPGQGRTSDAPVASSELTFAFNSWGREHAVTATLARSGYVHMNPSSDRVGTALLAAKPEERWLVERTASTGEDDNQGKQRRKRQ
jgi:hypothetical protein